MKLAQESCASDRRMIYDVETGVAVAFTADREDLARDGFHRTFEEDVANADLIVRAVNAHERLVAALKNILGAYDANDTAGIREEIERSRALTEGTPT